VDIIIIVAVDENNGIGKDNKLLYHLPNDLKRFKELTTNQTILMGKNTWNSLPVKPLPNRRNIILSDLEEDFGKENFFRTIYDAVATVETEKLFIVGGGMIYKQFINFADYLYVTKIHHTFNADTFFPKIDNRWELISSETIIDKINYSYLIYKKIK
jgi:dihydrofolate reductase